MRKNKNVEVGDMVILIDDGDANTARGKHGRRVLKANNSKHKRLAIIDTIDTIEGGKPKTKKEKFKGKDKDSNEEDEADKSKRLAKGLPVRRMYRANPDWFKFQSGLQANIIDVDLDIRFIDDVVKPFQES